MQLIDDGKPGTRVVNSERFNAKNRGDYSSVVTLSDHCIGAGGRKAITTRPAEDWNGLESRIKGWLDK